MSVETPREQIEKQTMDVDVLVIGGGMSGLALGEEVSNQLGKDKVLVVESTSEVGGRVYTHKEMTKPPDDQGGRAEYGFKPGAEGGAQMVYGGVLKAFAEAHGLIVKDVGDRYDRANSYVMSTDGLKKESDVFGDFDYNDAIDGIRVEIRAHHTNISVREFLDTKSDTYSMLTDDQRVMVDRMIELEYAVPLDELGTIVYGPATENTENAGFIGQIEGGYQLLPNAMAKNVNVKLGTTVRSIGYGPDGGIIVNAVTTHDGKTREMVIKAKSVALAVPVPVLKKGGIKFPESIDVGAIIDKETTETTGYGKAVKVVCEFAEPVWPADMKTIKSLEGPIGEAWVTSEGGRHLLTVWIAGKDAEQLETNAAGDSKRNNPLPIVKESLKKMFGDDQVERNLGTMNVMPWSLLKQAGLAYRASKPTGADFADIKKPMVVETPDPRIIMVGADLNSATVAKALSSGLKGAEYMVGIQNRTDDIKTSMRSELGMRMLKQNA